MCLETGKLVAGGAKEQSESALTHLKNILRASGSNLNNVVKTTVYLQDFNDFAVVNEAYKEGELLILFFSLFFCFCLFQSKIKMMI